MAFTDFGLEKIGSYIIGDVSIYPGSMAFGNSGSAFIGSQAYLGGEFYRKKVSWTFGADPTATVTISSTEGNGNYFNELGLVGGVTLGSDIFSRDLSAIGSKNNTFDVDISMTVRVRRP